MNRKIVDFSVGKFVLMPKFADAAEMRNYE